MLRKCASHPKTGDWHDSVICYQRHQKCLRLCFCSFLWQRQQLLLITTRATTTITTNQNNQKTTYLVTHNERCPSSRYACFPCDIDICSDCAGKEVKGVFFSRIKHFLKKKEGHFPPRPNCLIDSGDVV